MRWESLFADLEAQLAAADRAVLAGEVADRTRLEHSRLGLADRLRGALGRGVTIDVGTAGVVTGRLLRAGPDWCLVGADSGAETVVVLAAATAVSGLSGAAQDAASAGTVAARLGLGHVLRGIARDRSPVTVVLRSGVTLTGTLERVGADAVDLSEHPLDERRRPAAVRGVRTLTYAGLASVTRVPG